MAQQKWLLLLYGLSAKHGRARVNLWRQLKRCGALPWKTSAYLLPDRPEHFERLQWLAQHVRDDGGEATLLRVSEIEGMSDRDIIRQFNEARAEDYGPLIAALTQKVGRKKQRAAASIAVELAELTRQFEDIRRIDFFECPRAQDVQMLLKRAGELRAGTSKTPPLLSAKRFAGRTWLTRPRPEIDRIGSAWLIRKFIDPSARFVFANDPAKQPNAIPYDMFEAEFSHHGEDCTFETLVKRFGISDKAVKKMAEMVHDADLEDGKFHTAECLGLDRVVKGWAKAGLTDEELLARGGQCFDALYLYLSK